MSEQLDLDRLDLDRLEAVTLDATPGPWWLDENTGLIISRGNFLIDDCLSVEDRAFIIAANPATVLALIARIRDLETALCEECYGAESMDQPECSNCHYPLTSCACLPQEPSND